MSETSTSSGNRRLFYHHTSAYTMSCIRTR